MPQEKESFQSSVTSGLFYSLYRFLGSYGLGIVLMLILLILTYYGTIFQVRYAEHAGGAAEAFFSRSWVNIPLGGENALIALPLPGMWVTCCLLFINLMVGGIFRLRKDVSHWGILFAHVGVLLLLGSVALGNWQTQVIEEIRLSSGSVQRIEPMGVALKLKQFTPEFYPGTMKPKSFESALTIIEDGKESPLLHIRMNEPLRIHGWTLYQMSWGQQGGGMISILRASHNPFEQGPKWASYLISAGLLLHFSLMFVRYLRGKKKEESSIPEEKESESQSCQSWGKRLLLCGVGLFVVALFCVGMLASRPPTQLVDVSGYTPWSKDFSDQMESVALEDGGRLKPFSTYSGFIMLRSLGKRSLTIETNGEKIKISPTQWALDCMIRPEYARKFPIFLVNRDELVTRLGLPPLADKRKRYSFEQLEPRLNEIYEQAAAVERVSKPSDVEKDIAGLAQNVRQVELWMGMPVVILMKPDMLSSAGFPRWFHSQSGWTSIPTLKMGQALVNASVLARKGLKQDTLVQKQSFLSQAESILKQAFINENAKASSPSRDLISTERAYYHLDPLYIAMGLFVVGFVFSILGIWVSPQKKNGFVGWGLGFLSGRGLGVAWLIGLLGVGVLVTGMLMRSLITLRSPVGNTYETIAFIACSGVIVALVMEAIGKKGIILAAGLLLGFFACQMGIMYEARQATDHMDPLVAILRTNFLLSTHVITIVLGYAAGLLAAIFSHIYLLSAPCRLIDEKTGRMLTRMAYGALCFSLLFTLIGTVFGGIWGNEAWGRFWGWDPKENGALMIVLWQLILLHAKLGGYIRKWGLHMGNIIGGIIIAFAWWGVNTLGVGLHSYGFSQGRDALHLFYLIEGVLLLLFLILRYRRK
ncbi:MAG: cytochrome c biogenesis protein CcsA [Akkermansia sp.]